MSALPGTTGRRRIYLLRHGHVDYLGRRVQETGRWDEVELTDLGRAQAAATGKALAHVRFDVALSSGYPRTRQTAEIVLAENRENGHLTLRHDARLVELKGGGVGTFKSRTELSARMAFEMDQASVPGATMFGGEVFEDALARARAGILDLLAEPGWHTALVVAHEGINRLLLSWAAARSLIAVGAFEQDLSCVNVLDFDLVPKAEGEGTEIARVMIKGVNLTPYNWTKHGMNLTSLEAIFSPLDEEGRIRETG